MGQVERLKNGLPLERPTRIHPVRKGSYLFLQVEVRSSSTTSRLVGVKLHRLVYALVHDHIPAGKDVHHKDGNTMNNGSHNLVALSPQEHVDINRQTGVYKHLNNKPLISREDPVIQEIQQLRESGLSFRQIARQVGYSYPTCYRIVSGTYPFQEPAKD